MTNRSSDFTDKQLSLPKSWSGHHSTLRMAASTLHRSQSYLEAQYCRMRTKLGTPKVITAMAHQLARLVYRMLKRGQQYVNKAAELYDLRGLKSTANTGDITQAPSPWIRGLVLEDLVPLTTDNGKIYR